MTNLKTFTVVLSLFCSAAACAEEEPVKRSSHPYGFASDGNQSTLTVSSPQGPVDANNSENSASAPASSASTTPAGVQTRQTTSGGVNLSGTARIDARAQSTNATAVGQENTSGNRVGSIGGK